MEIVIGFSSLGLLALGNIIMVAYSYGKTTEHLKGLDGKVESLDKRVERVENRIINGKE